ncbi:hypothetical protein RQ762_21015 [Roseomonas mucosa]|nr:hypothetical protein [Roseomonas mucosa]
MKEVRRLQDQVIDLTTSIEKIAEIVEALAKRVDGVEKKAPRAR